MTDTDRPTGASLTETEADRLSERFTASWDDPAAWAANKAGEPPPSPPPAADAAPAARPKNQTLLGIAPIVISSQPPAAAPAVASTPPSPQPVPSPSAIVSPSAPSSPAAASSPIVAPSPSSPDASSVARGLTTPSKPYIPKDDPSTPAVVISESALSDAKRKADRARIAQTIPAQTRSAALGSQSPIAAPIVPVPPVAAAAPTSEFDEPPARRSRAPWLLAVAGLTATAVAAGTLLMQGGPTENPAASAPAIAEAPAPPPAIPAASATQDRALEPAPPPEPVAADSAPSPAAAVVAAAPPPAPERRRKPLPKKPAATAASTPSVRKSSSSARPAAEPGTTTKPVRGVIVRETPF